jgi:hypothetical protein
MKPTRPPWIRNKQVFHMNVFDFVKVIVEFLPVLGLGWIDIWQHINNLPSRCKMLVIFGTDSSGRAIGWFYFFVFILNMFYKPI